MKNSHKQRSDGMERQRGVLVITGDTEICPNDPEIPIFNAPDGFYAGAVVSGAEWEMNTGAVCGKAVFINPVSKEVLSPSVHVPVSVNISKKVASCVARIQRGRVVWADEDMNFDLGVMGKMIGVAVNQ